MELIEKQKDDPRSYNTLAVALFQNGREAEAIEYLEKAIALGDEKAAENLSDVKKYLKQREEYEKYLKEVEDYNKKVEEFNRTVNQLKQNTPSK